MLADPEQAKLLKRKPDYSKAMREMCEALQIKYPVPECMFCPGRKWRFDWAWPQVKIAIEIDGGILHGGRHTTSISGRLRDMEKLNAAASMGWLVLTATTLPSPVYAKKKKLLPWLCLSDPIFRAALKTAFQQRQGLLAMTVWGGTMSETKFTLRYEQKIEQLERDNAAMRAEVEKLKAERDGLRLALIFMDQAMGKALKHGNMDFTHTGA